MTNEITDVANNFQTQLTQIVGPDALSYPVSDLGGVTSPCYITIDPDVPDKREVIKCDGTFGGSTFTSTDLSRRALPGSSNSTPVQHDVDAIVVISPLAQHIDDLNDRVTLHTHQGGVAGAPISHSLLRDNDEDNHLKYPLVTGQRGFSGPVPGKDPQDPAHLATAAHVSKRLSTYDELAGR